MQQSISAWIGLDVGKADHHATVIDADGQIVFDRALRNEQSAIERLLDDAGDQTALVIDQPGSIGALAVAVARGRGIPVAYVPGLVMRRASELYPGEAKTDRRDSFVIADTARIHRARVHWLAESEEVLEQLRVLGGYDDDLAHDRTRAANRLRDMLLQASPAVERVLGDRLEHPAVRALLERYPTPSAMRAAGPRRMRRIVTPRAPRMGQRLIDELQAAPAAQTVSVPAEATIGRVISDLAVELGRLAAAREKLADEIEAVFASHPQAPVLLSIPGIGGHGPEHGSSPRSVTSLDPRPPATSPPTPGWRPSPSNRAAPSTASTAHAAATTASKTRSGSQRSAACTTHPPATTTPASAPKAKSTTPRSYASPAAAATSSTRCSPPATPTANCRQDRHNPSQSLWQPDP